MARQASRESINTTAMLRHMLRLLTVLLIALLLLVHALLWLPRDSGFNRVSQLKEAIEYWQQQNKQLTIRNSALEAEISSLRTGVSAIEERARYDLGMIRPGETLFRILDAPGDQ